jgi:hypothetical protein
VDQVEEQGVVAVEVPKNSSVLEGIAAGLITVTVSATIRFRS